MTQKQIYIALGAAAVLVLAVIAYFVLGSGSDGGSLTATQGGGSTVTLTAADRGMGSPKARVVIVEYFAPSCPHCAHWNEEVFPLLRAKYIDTGKVYYVGRVFPISSADGAAEALARCLPADNYFSFIDLLFRNQTKWDPEYGVTDVHGALIQMGRIAGMGADQVDQCISNTAEAERINKVATDGEAQFHIHATPTFIINGVVQTAGAITWTTLQQTLDSLLSKK